jgi:hypothetical protein
VGINAIVVSKRWILSFFCRDTLSVEFVSSGGVTTISDQNIRVFEY